MTVASPSESMSNPSDARASHPFYWRQGPTVTIFQSRTATFLHETGIWLEELRLMQAIPKPQQRMTAAADWFAERDPLG